MYTIKEMSERFELPASTIRYYEEIGLLENVEHKDRYHRIYTDEHVDRLNAIECFKKARLSLEDIKAFFEYEKDIQTNSGRILAMMTEQEQKTIAEMESLQLGLDHVRKKIKYYMAVDEAIRSGRKIPSWNEIISEEKA